MEEFNKVFSDFKEYQQSFIKKRTDFIIQAITDAINKNIANEQEIRGTCLFSRHENKQALKNALTLLNREDDNFIFNVRIKNITTIFDSNGLNEEDIGKIALFYEYK